MKEIEELRFSEFRDLFYNTLRAMFAQDIESDEDAIFVKQLLDYILRHIDDSRVKGLEEEMVPIGYITIWQGAKSHNSDIFSIRAQAGIKHNEDNNIRELMENLKEAVYKWGDSTLDGVVKLGDENSEVSYFLDEDEDETE